MRLELPTEAQIRVEARLQKVDAELDDQLQNMVRCPNSERQDVRELAFNALCTWLRCRQCSVAAEWIRIAPDEAEFSWQVAHQDDLTLTEGKAREKFLNCCRLLNTISMTPIEFPKVVQDGFYWVLYHSRELWCEDYRKVRVGADDGEPCVLDSDTFAKTDCIPTCREPQCDKQESKRILEKPALEADAAERPKVVVAPHPVPATMGSNRNPIPQFPKRASWLKNRLRERSWNKHDLSRHGGPTHKTVQKVLDGFPVREDVLQKVADALSKRGTVTVLEIPQD